ncbi:MAG: tripartite tricarboxylate transporter substrate binding protein, partial [Burkholderiales bacterium]
VLNKFHAEVARAVSHPDFRQRMAKDGADAIGSTPQEFAAHLRSEMTRWAAVAQRTGMKVE